MKTKKNTKCEVIFVCLFRHSNEQRKAISIENLLIFLNLVFRKDQNIFHPCMNSLLHHFNTFVSFLQSIMSYFLRTLWKKLFGQIGNRSFCQLLDNKACYFFQTAQSFNDGRLEVSHLSNVDIFQRHFIYSNDALSKVQHLTEQ